VWRGPYLLFNCAEVVLVHAVEVQHIEKFCLC
jgi:hypothetical protein